MRAREPQSGIVFTAEKHLHERGSLRILATRVQRDSAGQRAEPLEEQRVHLGYCSIEYCVSPGRVGLIF